jgi:hypothetical protein
MGAKNEEDVNVEEEEVVEEEIESEEDLETDLENGDDDDGEKTIEPWEEELEEKPVTVNAQIKQRRKFQKREEVIKAENMALKAENEKLKNSGTQNKTTLPQEEDFDTWEEFKEAEGKYTQDLIKSQINTESQKAVDRKIQESVEKEVGNHYTRVDSFLQESGIKQEIYDKSDETVRQVIEDIIPGGGDNIFEALISKMGEGSEKVTYFIGRNKAEFQSKLMSDKTGIEAAIYLGRKLEQFNNSSTKKRKSKAPAPASNANGDASVKVVSASGKAFKKKYDALHKSKDTTVAFNVRQEARRAGVDVSSW